MKYKRITIISLILALSLMVFGCAGNKKDDNLEKELTKKLEEEKKEEIAKEYENALILGDKEIVNLTEFIEENIALVDREMANRMVLDLEEKLLVNRNRVEEAIIEKDTEDQLKSMMKTERFFPESSLSEIKNKDLKNYLEDVFKANYKLGMNKENLALSIDYDKLLKYDIYIDEGIIQYMSLKATEVNNPAREGQKILVAFDELEERLFKMEDYLRKYKNLEENEDIIKCYRENMILYLNGTRESPIYKKLEAREENKILVERMNKGEDNITIYGRVDEELKKSYVKASKKDNTSSKIIREYLDYLEARDMIVDGQTEVKVLSLVNKATNTLEELHKN